MSREYTRKEFSLAGNKQTHPALHDTLKACKAEVPVEKGSSLKILWMLLAVFLLFLTANSLSQQSKQVEASDCVILYGPEYSFSICTYEGWIIESTDQTLGRIARLSLKEGDSISSDVYGYVTVDAKPDIPPDNVEQAIKAYIDNYVASNPGMKATKERPLFTKDKKKAQVIRFISHSSGRCEVASIIQENKILVRIGFVSKTSKNFSDVRRQLRKVVNSYCLLGLKPQEQK